MAAIRIRDPPLCIAIHFLFIHVLNEQTVRNTLSALLHAAFEPDMLFSKKGGKGPVLPFEPLFIRPAAVKLLLIYHSRGPDLCFTDDRYLLTRCYCSILYFIKGDR
jgi:hypothetical protein